MNVRKGWAPYLVLLAPADAGGGSGTTVVTQTPEQIAAAQATADQAAATQVAADAAAAAGKTPEQLAADTAAAEAETARTAAAQAKAPEKYELTLPENSAHLTDDDLALVASDAKALGLTNDQAQSLVHARETQMAAVTAQFLTDAKADPDLGGAKWDDTVKHALAGRNWLFPEGADRDLIIGWFDRTGLGNHKAFLRAMARIGKANAEDQAGSGRSTSGSVERLPTEDVLFPSSAKSKA